MKQNSSTFDVVKIKSPVQEHWLIHALPFKYSSKLERAEDLQILLLFHRNN